MIEQNTVKSKLLDTIRRLIYLLPRSKFLNFLGFSYMAKYQNLLNIDKYSNGEFRYVSESINKGDRPIIFDVGANIGEWTQSVLEIRSDVEIYAFEPFEDSFTQFKARAFPPKVSAFNIGLGKENTREMLYIYKNASTHNSLYPSSKKSASSVIEINVERLDDFCANNNISHIDFLKIDVEGNDYNVLLGAKRFLGERRIRYIQFEYNDNYIEARIFLKDIFDFLEPLPYSIFKIFPDKLVHIPKYHHHYENFLYANYAIVLDSELDE